MTTTVEDVFKSYGKGDQQVSALRGVSAEFGPGTFTAVMGPSGSGKSTLLRCAAGLERPDSGSVVLDGQEIASLKEPALTEARRQSLGFIFQAYNLVGTLNVRQNLELPSKLAGRRIARGRVKEVLAQVGLEGRERARPGELSGGQQQRVAIARALVGESKALFADEPTGALDRSTGRTILELLRTAVTGGQAVVMVTHDPSAAAFADRVLYLVDGRIAHASHGGEPEEIASTLSALEER